MPGRLVSGLRRLTHVEEWLNQDASQHAAELALKRKGLTSRRHQCLHAEENSVAAQAECLDAFLEYLPQRYPDLYRVEGTDANRTVTVLTTGETHAVSDFAHAPLELCNRIVQEDLVLMRASEQPTAEHRHVMAAASVVFSFGDLDKKLGQPLAFIHAPVPGFEKDLAKLLNKTFDGLQAAAPVWRNNWALVDNGVLDNPSYGTPEALASISKILPPETRWLKVEYQTLRRLPTTGYILFTVRTFLEPITVLARYPAAAANLAASLRGMSQPMRAYKGLVEPQAQAEMLSYLESLVPTVSAR
jgi:dimethylamine monooxygenase subunit A